MNLFGNQRRAQRGHSGFTLIELLVVIAIIAILAAILFPVFARAKAAAKKISDLSNMKQLGTAVAIYNGDNDDLNPLQSGRNQDGSWAYDRLSYIPADWRDPGYDGAIRCSSFVMNAIQPYIKSYQMMEIPGAPAYYLPFPAYAANPKMSAAPYAYNGLLSSYSASSVAAPSQLALFTELNSFSNFMGFSVANPQMDCPIGPAACAYAPASSGPCSSANGGRASIHRTWPDAGYWCNGQGQNWVMTDGHAKWRKMGANISPNGTDYTIDPMTNYDATGHSYNLYMDPRGCYPYLFRPDFDFNFTGS